MSKHCTEIAFGTKMSMVKHLCWRGRVEEAWEVQGGGRGMAWSESLASHFVQGYAALGRLDAAEDVLQMLNDKNIHWGNVCYEAMVLGCARAGDMDRVEFFLDRLNIVILEVFHELLFVLISLQHVFCFLLSHD